MRLSAPGAPPRPAGRGDVVGSVGRAGARVKAASALRAPRAPVLVLSTCLLSNIEHFSDRFVNVCV